MKTESTYLRLDNISGFLETYRGSTYNVLHLNIHSLPSKYTELCNMLYLLKNNVHLVLLCETFLNSLNAQDFSDKRRCCNIHCQ